MVTLGQALMHACAWASAYERLPHILQVAMIVEGVLLSACRLKPNLGLPHLQV